MSDVVVMVSNGNDIPVIVDGSPGVAGPVGPAGDVAKAADRTALGAVVASSGLTRYLTESGREGIFVFSSANHAADVTSDPNQGTYVAPASDTTGASGAWVRKFSGSHNVTWFGATGDGVTNDGAAVLAAIAHLNATAQAGFGYGSGAPTLFFPYGEYYLGTNTLDITTTIIMEGASVGQEGGGATVLRWAAGATGIRVQTHNTTGASGTQASQPIRGDGSIFRNLFLKGAFATTEAEAHGFHLRGRATIRDCYVYGFEGDGIYSIAGAGGGGAIEGNANNIRIEDCLIQNCRNGIFFDNADTNAGLISGVSANDNRRWGFYDSSFLGNTYIACHASGNGYQVGSLAPTLVVQSGKRYAVIPGQETGASTNAPSGTTADNTWWYYVETAGVVAGIPAWVSGTTYRTGGPYYSDSANARTLFVNCYSEGSQGPSYGLTPATFLHGLHGAGIKGTAIYARGEQGYLTSSKVLTENDLVGNSTGLGAVLLGPQGGTAADSNVYLENTNSSSNLWARQWTAGAPTNIGYIQFSYAGGMVVNVLNAAYTVTHLINSATVSTLSANGLSVAGFIKSIHATAGVGYATGAGGAVTQITSRTTGVTLNTACGAITLFSAAGSTTFASFTVTNSAVAATDVIRVVQKSGTDKYAIWVTAVAAGSFQITFATLSGTTVEQPVFNFAVIKAVAA